MWLWALAAFAAILASMSYSPRLAQMLREQGVLEATFIAGVSLIAVFVLWDAVNTRLGRRDLAILLGIAAVYLITFSRIGLPEERTHLIEYGVVAVLVYRALLERKENGRRVWSPALSAVLAVAILGGIDEAVQLLHPERVFDWRDVGFNCLAGILAVTANKAILLTKKHS